MDFSTINDLARRYLYADSTGPGDAEASEPLPGIRPGESPSAAEEGTGGFGGPSAADRGAAAKKTPKITFQQSAGVAFDFGTKEESVKGLAFGGNLSYGVTFGGGGLPDWLGFGATVKASSYLHRHSQPAKDAAQEAEAGAEPEDKAQATATRIWGVSGFVAPEIVFTLDGDLRIYSGEKSSGVLGTSQLRFCPAGAEFDYREVRRSDGSERKPFAVNYAAQFSFDFYFTRLFEPGEFAFGLTFAGSVNHRAEAKGSAGLIFAF